MPGSELFRLWSLGRRLGTHSPLSRVRAPRATLQKLFSRSSWAHGTTDRLARREWKLFVATAGAPQFFRLFDYALVFGPVLVDAAGVTGWELQVLFGR